MQVSFSEDLSYSYILLFQYVEEKLSKKILDQARLQQNELEEEYRTKKPVHNKKSYLGSHSKKKPADSSDEEEDDNEDFSGDQFYENIVSRSNFIVCCYFVRYPYFFKLRYLFKPLMSSAMIHLLCVHVISLCRNQVVAFYQEHV